jgi:hypothetical protein
MLISFSHDAVAKEWFVAPDGAGSGTKAAPLGAVQAALLVAQPGDTVLLRAGTYRESIRTIRNGGAGAPITLRAEDARRPQLTTPGTVIQIDHSYIVVNTPSTPYARRTAVNVSDRVSSIVPRRGSAAIEPRLHDIGAAVNAHRGFAYPSLPERGRAHRRARHRRGAVRGRRL